MEEMGSRPQQSSTPIVISLKPSVYDIDFPRDSLQTLPRTQAHAHMYTRGHCTGVRVTSSASCRLHGCRRGGLNWGCTATQ